MSGKTAERKKRQGNQKVPIRCLLMASQSRFICHRGSERWKRGIVAAAFGFDYRVLSGCFGSFVASVRFSCCHLRAITDVGPIPTAIDQVAAKNRAASQSNRNGQYPQAVFPPMRATQKETIDSKKKQTENGTKDHYARSVVAVEVFLRDFLGRGKQKLFFFLGSLCGVSAPRRRSFGCECAIERQK